MDQARIFYQQDCDINVLKGKKVAIIGYGTLSTSKKAALTFA